MATDPPPSGSPCALPDAVPGRVPPFEGACRWLISLDYDGTLRNPDGSPLSPDFLELMARWRREGVRWGVNTGRSMPYLLEELLPGLPALPDFLCTCERYVYLADGTGRLRAARLHNAHCEAHNLALRAACVPVAHEFLARLRRERPQLEWEYAADDPLSIEAADSATMDALLPELRQLAAKLPGAVIQRAGRYLRFSDARHNKGSALGYIARTWRVAPDHLVLMGDGQNDIDAFRLFPRSFRAAPAGAHPEVLSYLRRTGGYLSSTPGVGEALRHWGRSVRLSAPE